MRTSLALFGLSLCLIAVSPRLSTAAPGLIRSWGGFGDGAGQFNNPYGIVVDENQVIYVTDEGNDRIQSFDSTGVFLGQWGAYGNDPGQLFNPTGIDIGADGLAYISDHQNHRISVFTTDGAFVRTFTDPGLSYPVGLDCDPSGHLWVASLNGLYYFSSTGTLQAIIHMSNGESPYGITADGTTLYASLCGANRIEKVSLTPFSREVFALGLYCPEGSLLDSNGDFLVCDTGHDRILKYDPSGALLSQIQLSTNPRAIPSDIAVDNKGDLYVAEWGLHKIEKYSPTAFVLIQCTGTVSAGGPYQTTESACVQLNGVVTDPNFTGTWNTNGSGSFIPDNTALGALYCPSAADVAAGTVTLTLSAGLCPPSQATLTIVTLPPPSFSFIRAWGTEGSGPGQFTRPVGIVVDETQTVYVTDSGNSRIQKFDSTGVYLGEWGHAGTRLNQLINPQGIDIGPDGFAYISDNGNQRISVFTRDGFFVRVFGVPGGGNPKGLNCEPSGNLWVASLTGFYRFSSTGTMLQTIDASDGSANWVTADGNNLYGSHCSLGVAGVQKYTLSPPSVQPFAADIFCPGGSSLDAEGNFWICDSGNDRIRKYASSGALLGTLQLSTSPRAIPLDIAFDINGDLYVTETGLNRIAKYSVGGHEGAPCTVSAGGPYASCGNACVELHGDVDPALTGIWSTNGSGTFTPNNATLNATYCPSAADIAAGSVTLTLTAAPCPGVTATLTITPGVTLAAMEIDPNTINTGAGGNYISAHLEFPSGYDPSQVQLGTVMLNETVAASPDFFDVKDWNHNHVPDVTVKFPREAVEAALQEGDEVPISITGMIGTTCFAGTTTVRVIRPHLTHPNGGESYLAGVSTLVEWENPQGWTVSYAQIYYSPDGGDNWSLTADLVSGTTFVWAAPADPTTNARLRVVLIDGDGVMGYDSSDESFTVRASTTGIAEGTPTVRRLYQNSPNPFTNATQVWFDLPEASRVTIEVFDLTGRKLKVLTDTWYPVGSHEVTWDARDGAGHPVAGGIYFLHLQADSFSDTKRMFLQR